MGSDSPSMSAAEIAAKLDAERLELERSRYRMDILKWVVVAVGAAVSFAVIDYGRLRLEQFRVNAGHQQELLNAYLRATESPEPEVWKRKLQLIIKSTEDKNAVRWAQEELNYIEGGAALDALYRETLKIASQLVEPDRVNEPDRVQARARYNQLYWADLPYAGESQQVATAMIEFRKQLILAEAATPESSRLAEGRKEWEELNRRLITLSAALRESTPGRTRKAP